MKGIQFYIILLVMTLWLTACVTITTEPLDLDIANGSSDNLRILTLGGDVAPSMTVGDFNGDGCSDLAIITLNADSIRILLGNKEGTFVSKLTSLGEVPRSIAVGDFNGDGRSDLAVTNRASNDVRILFGNGDGSFFSSSTLAANDPSQEYPSIRIQDPQP